MLDSFQTEQQDGDAAAARMPAQTIETTPTQAFSAAWDASTRNDTVMASVNNMADAAQDHLDRVEQVTGERLPNPYRSGAKMFFLGAGDQQGALDQVQDRTQDLAEKFNDPSLNFPDNDTLYQSGLAKARAAQQNVARISQGAQGFGSGIAGIAAGLGAQFSDPVTAGLNIAALTTLPEGNGLLRSALLTGTSMAAQQAAQEALTFNYKRAVKPEYGFGDSAEEIATAGLGGVALDLGGKFLGMGAGAIWRSLRTTAPDVAARVAPELQDAANVAERVQDIAANNPFRTGVDGAAAHGEAVTKIENDLMTGQTPELPASAADHARTIPDHVQQLDASARAAFPDLYQRADGLDSDIAQGRAELARIAEERAAGPADLGGERIADLQSQLAAFTGKRRSSPAGQDIRDEIDRLQSENVGIGESSQQALDDRENLVRMRLLDKTTERARLGPEINAARNNAPLIPEAPVREDPIVKAYGDQTSVSGLIGHPDKHIQAIGEALSEVAPEWGRIKDAVSDGTALPGHDITPDVLQAAAAVRAAKDKGTSIWDELHDSFASDTATQAARMFYRDEAMTKPATKNRIAGNLRSFAEGIAGSPEEIAPRAVESIRPIAKEQNVTAMTAQASAPEAIDKAFVDPKTHDAMFADLDRSISVGRNRVPIEDENGGVSLGFADKELNDINNQLSLADEVRGCAGPVQEAAE